MSRGSIILCVVFVLVVGPVASADLVGWWKLDEGTGTTILDSSGNGLDGTFVNGSPQWIAGRDGRAIDFGGGTGYVDLGANSAMDITGEITVACWLKDDGFTTGWQAIFTKGLGWRLQREASERTLEWTCPGLTLPTAYLFSEGTVDDGEWHHVAGIYDGQRQALFIDGELDVEMEASGQIGSTSYHVMIGSIDTLTDRVWNGPIDDVRLYNHGMTQEEILGLMAFSSKQAGDPNPEDRAVDVPRDVVLSWIAGKFAATHDVYFGTNFDDVNDAGRADGMGVLVSQGQAETGYDPDGLLDFAQTYYWRIDEVNVAPSNTIFKGNVWSFTSEPFAYAIENVVATSNGETQSGGVPQNTVNGSGLNENDEHSIESSDMWLAKPVGDEPVYIQFDFDRVYKMHEMLVWNYNVQVEPLLGFSAKDVTLEYSEDGVDWTVLGDVELAQGTGKADYVANSAIDLQGVPAQHVRLTITSRWGTMGGAQYGLSEVRFMQIPAHARQPQPADGATEVSVDTMLTWRAGRDAISHEVYLGTDPNALALVDAIATPSFNPGGLDLGDTYYWKVDEVQDVESWEGDLWSFATQEFIVIDDFESYTDDIDGGGAIFLTWLDGYGINDNGSQVGYVDAPFAEQTIVHGGGQSMPLLYANTGSAAISEAACTFDVAQNWSANGIGILSLYFRGTPGNSGQLYLKINNTQVTYDGAATDIGRGLWQPWIVDLSSVGADLRSVTTMTIGIEGAGATGTVYIDDIRLYPGAVSYITPVEPDPANLLVHYAFDRDATDSSGNAVHGEENGTPVYGDGVDGQALTFDGIDDYVNTVLDVPENGATTAFWFKTTNPNCGMFAVVEGLLGDGGYDRMIYLAEGNVGVRIYSDEVITAPVDVADGQWHHLVHAYGDAIAGQRLYIDGLLQASGAKATSDFDWQERVHFGWSVDATEAYFEGMLDEARIYDRVLSPAEIFWLAGQTTPVPEPLQ